MKRLLHGGRTDPLGTRPGFGAVAAMLAEHLGAAWPAGSWVAGRA